MIAQLKGLVDEIGIDGVILDVNGVGYVVAALDRTLRDLPALGRRRRRCISRPIVREDAISLYGFLAQPERNWFRMLQRCKASGSRSRWPSSRPCTRRYRRAPSRPGHGDHDPRAGRRAKLAARLVAELKDKAARLRRGGGERQRLSDALGAVPHRSDQRDAVSALVNLGYGRVEACGAVASASPSGSATPPPIDALIRASPQELAQ